MKRTPSYLKGLAETQARAAGDVLRFEKLLAEVDAKLVETKALAAIEVPRLEKLLVTVGIRIFESKAELAACDRLITKFDARLNPKLIAPIKAWKGRYGKRGELNSTICHILKDCAPEERTTFELSAEIRIRFKLDFSTVPELRAWQKNSVANALKSMVKMGLVERGHKVTKGCTGEVGRWRWKVEINTLDEVRASAAAQGVGVQQAPDDEDDNP